jgi:predicted 2-oxoglutarate/Fe(II)-dependent dioxygenase YbiX
MIHQQLLFNEEECNLIKSYVKLQPTELSKHFNIGDSYNFTDGNKLVATKCDTSYRVFVIENSSETEWMFNKLLEWFSDVNDIKINYNNKVKACTLHQYSVGDEFTKHIDLAKGFENRRYNLGIQLNDSYEGGEYTCWDDDNNEILISKKTGTAISYHCRIWHEIKKITNGERWSIVMPIKNHHIIEKINLI